MELEHGMWRSGARASPMMMSRGVGVDGHVEFGSEFWFVLFFILEMYIKEKGCQL